MRKTTRKEFHIDSYDDQRALSSAWQSSRGAFRLGRTFEVISGAGMIFTDLSQKDCRKLFRHAGVRWRDFVTGMEPETDEALS